MMLMSLMGTAPMMAQSIDSAPVVSANTLSSFGEELQLQNVRTLDIVFKR